MFLIIKPRILPFVMLLCQIKVYFTKKYSKSGANMIINFLKSSLLTYKYFKEIQYITCDPVSMIVFPRFSHIKDKAEAV